MENAKNLLKEKLDYRQRNITILIIIMKLHDLEN